ncbi:MAG: hypothetical protein MZV49_15640 [Rhodopseudomonas palustris]|nr:hypothetical protein [Rhodopseudomonas palustris]
MKARLKGHEDNPILAQLARCATEYHCLAAKNLFLGRWEAPLPVANSCNSACVGCLSWQPSTACALVARPHPLRADRGSRRRGRLAVPVHGPGGHRQLRPRLRGRAASSGGRHRGSRAPHSRHHRPWHDQLQHQRQPAPPGGADRARPAWTASASA